MLHDYQVTIRKLFPGSIEIVHCMVSGAKSKVRRDSSEEDYTPGQEDHVPGRRKGRRKRGRRSGAETQSYVSAFSDGGYFLHQVKGLKPQSCAAGD